MSDCPANLPPDELPVDYTEVAALGEGAFGRVLRARDAAGRAVAVKVLAPALANRAEVAWQFAGEYRKLARLDHPAFPHAHEEGRTPGGLPFYTMDLVTGRAPVGPLAPDGLRAVLVGVARGLAYLHGLGWTHGDLKPENLRVDERGGVVLLDVGLMAPVGQKREAIAGTLEYLAPEALRRAPVAPGVDLYALGVLAFELATGHPPFAGTPAELVRAHLTQDPPPVATGDPALDTLVRALLAKEPAARPVSAWAVLAALGEPVDPALLAGAGAGLQAAPFVGRAAILEAWRTVLATGGQVAVVGASGLGKSRTLDELRLAAQVAGRTWAGAACAGAGDAPGGPVRALVGQALGLAGQQATGVAAAWLAGEVPPELAELEPAARALVFQAAAADALAGAARALGGLALGLDDFHRADDITREFVGYWRRAMGEAPVAWALAADADEAPKEPVPLELLPFTPDEVAAVAAGRLAAPAPQALLALLAPAAGNPLLVDLLLEHLVASGRLVAGTSGWTLAVGAGELPASLNAAWEARFRGLAPEAWRLAAVAAVAAPAGALPVPALARALGVAPALIAPALDALAAEGVLAVEGGRARLAVPGLVAFFAGRASAAERAAWAATLAREVLGTDPASLDAASRAALPTDTLAPAAWLALASEAKLPACHLALEAARRGLSLGATGEALRLLAAADAVLPADAPERLALHFLKAEAERYSDQLAAAAEDYAAAAALPADDLTAARVLNGFAKVRQLQNAFDETLALVARATEHAQRAGDAGQVARAAIMEARVRLYQGKLPDAIAACERAATSARAGRARGFLGQALTLLGVLLAQAAPENAPRALEHLEEALAIGEALGDHLGVGLAHESVGNTCLALGDLVGAAAAFARCARTFAAIGRDTEALSAALNEAIVAGERGDLVAARALGEDVDRRGRAVGRKFPQIAAKTVLGQVAWRAGRPAEALAPLDEALALALEIKNRYLEEHVRLYRLEALLALGDWDEGRAEAARVREIAEATGHAEALARLAVLEARLARAAGELETARALATPLVDAPNRLPAHAALALLADLETAAGRPAEALAAAEQELAIARGWQAPWHEVAALARIARIEHARGERAAAAARAREAFEGAAEALNPYARARAALVLAAVGARGEDRGLVERVAGEWRTVVTGLTAQARAALLAAHELDALGPDLAAPPKGATGGAIDLALFTAAMQAVALENQEAALAEAALDAACALVAADRGYVLAYEGGRLRQAVTRGLDYEGEAARFSHTIAERVLFSGEPVYVMDASGDAEWQAAASVMALGLVTVLCVPLAVGSELLGVLYLEREAVDPVLSDADVTAVAALASFTAAQVVAARARLAVERAERCAGLAARLAADAPPEAVQRALVASAREAVDADRALWLERSGQRWEARLALGRDGRALAAGQDVASQGIAGWVAERQEALAILDTQSDSAWEARQSVQALGLRTVWCLPVGPALLYLDAADLEGREPLAALRTLEAIVEFSLPLLGFAEV